MYYFYGFNLSFSDSQFSYMMDWFHSFNYSLLWGVLVFVSFVFLFLMTTGLIFKSNQLEYQSSEFLCSIIPTLVLLVQMFPSLGLLYFYGTMSLDPQLTIKVTGHQWYWSYDYSDVFGINFDSYMKTTNSLELSEFRTLDVDNRSVLPLGVDLRFCISSSDVIHCWTLSSMSLKVDAMSGYLSILNYNFPVIGVYYGQCSEICGANHSFMPIVVEVSIFSTFKDWCLHMTNKAFKFF